MLSSVSILVVSLVAMVAAAALFTNAVEWVGEHLDLSHNAVGSLFAALGTALPETMVPVMAILFGSRDEANGVGTGAILGAPFMLATLAFFVVGVAAMIYKGSRQPLDAKPTELAGDLGFFLLFYLVSVAAALLPVGWLRVLVALGLLAAYLTYVIKKLQGAGRSDDQQPSPLVFHQVRDPHWFAVYLQLAFSLAAIAAAAHYFATALQAAASAWGVPSLVLALLIVPLATELPEQLNSVIWIRQGKDTLALSNVTGAMVFQSSVIPAIGIAFTSWSLGPIALFNVTLALVAGAYVWLLARRGSIRPLALLLPGSLYLLFMAATIWMLSSNLQMVWF